ncbi:hypothetical protein GOODEAATRI_004467, partial [Goodea atripinnis]
EHENGVADCSPAQPSQSKSSSADILRAGISPMATISSINIDLPSQQNDDVVKKQVQRPPSVKRSREPVARIVHRDSKVRGKPDPSPPASPVNPPVGASSGVCGRGGHQRTASNGLLDIQPNPCGACPVSVEKPDSDVDSKDDTSELLREASVQSSNAENIVVDVGNKNDAVTLITRSSSDCQREKTPEAVPRERRTSRFGCFLLRLGPSTVRRASYDVAKAERHNVPVTRSASYSTPESNSKVQTLCPFLTWNFIFYTFRILLLNPFYSGFGSICILFVLNFCFNAGRTNAAMTLRKDAGQILPFEAELSPDIKLKMERKGEEIPVLITATEDRLGAVITAMNSVYQNSKANVVFTIVTLNDTVGHLKENLYSNALADSVTTPPLLIVFYKRHSSIDPMWHVRHLDSRIRVGLEVFTNKSRLAFLSSFPEETNRIPLKSIYIWSYLIILIAVLLFSLCGWWFVRSGGRGHQTCRRSSRDKAYAA